MMIIYSLNILNFQKLVLLWKMFFFIYEQVKKRVTNNLHNPTIQLLLLS